MVQLGFKSLWNHRLRSLLTMLGIVFGVCSVIAMLAVGEGASHEAQEQIKRLGSNNIILRSVKPPEGQKASTETQHVSQYGLRYEDVDRLRATIPGISIIVPVREIPSFVWHSRHKVDTTIRGTVPWYPEMKNRKIVRGRYFNEQEMAAKTNVCVLGADAARALFPAEDPLGGKVRVGSDYYRVIGIVEPEAKASQAKQEEPNGESESSKYEMFVPLSSAKIRFGELIIRRRSGSVDAERVELHELTVRVSDLDAVADVAAIIKVDLERNHKKEDYEMTVPLTLLQQAKRTKQMFSIVLGTIAGISLLVGGIGIMNIMLASVTERTREIGIRRAMGAKRRDIITQFLIETVILSGVGGALGVILGVTIPFLIEAFADMETIIVFWSPPLAFSISALVGVIFGIYPAMRAANMDPVEALRHE
ncbi:MAG: ABC transporter permease [Candidatus Hydrogenedentes bacterium]|nr:ABC transporter permease [Candidatus Hydrogenedentota bacterium]